MTSSEYDDLNKVLCNKIKEIKSNNKIQIGTKSGLYLEEFISNNMEKVLKLLNSNNDKVEKIGLNIINELLSITKSIPNIKQEGKNITYTKDIDKTRLPFTFKRDTNNSEIYINKFLDLPSAVELNLSVNDKLLKINDEDVNEIQLTEINQKINNGTTFVFYHVPNSI